MSKQRSQPVLEPPSARREFVEGTPVMPLEFVQDGARAFVKAATLTQVVQLVSERGLDSVTLQHLALAHGQFVPSVKLLQKVAVAFDADSASAPVALQKKMRLLALLKTWLALAGDTLTSDEELRGALEAFLVHLKATNEGLANYLELSTKRAMMDDSTATPAVAPGKPSGPRPSSSFSSPSSSHLCSRGQASLGGL